MAAIVGEYKIPKLNNFNNHAWLMRVKRVLQQKKCCKAVLDPGFDEELTNAEEELN